MLNDQRTSYRWQDHVITPRRATLNLLATALIVAVVAAGLHGSQDSDPAPATHVAAVTERTPSLAHLVKRPATTHSRAAAFKGC